MGVAQWLVLAVTMLRLGELVHARRNAKRLLNRGGQEHGAGHYPLFIALHAAWLVAIFAAVPVDAPLSLPLVALFAVLLAARVWTIASLGQYWTTRVITRVGEPLVSRGPYRFVRHPNYLLVAGEIAVLPLIFGAWRIALLFSLLNAALLWQRLRVEEKALEPRRSIAPPWQQRRRGPG